MKSRILGIALVGLMAFGGTTVASAADPGPNGNNDHGLCTAYFNGQKNGHDKNGQPGPFQALEDTGRAYANSDGRDNDGDGQVDEGDEGANMSAAEAVFNYCNDNSVIGGNPDHGRYDCTQDGDQTTCGDNPAPGNSSKKNG